MNEMPDFSPTHYVMLLSGSEDTPGRLVWATQLNFTTTVDVIDVGNDNILSEDSDLFDVNAGVYSGWYITVGGNNYGIFSTNIDGIYTIPYDANFQDLRVGNAFVPEILAGQTTLWDDTLENAANCFLTGTQITTPEGARAVETLQPGDHVLTADGTATPVLWVWRQEITNIFGLGEARMPIRVSTDALGPGCPARDLILTADHALVVDGFLINAGALVNGTTIAPIPLARMPARFTYWHVETEAHSVLLAENCPSESFIDYTPRAGFDNYAEYVGQGGDDPVITELPMPRISTPRLLLPALRQRLGIGRAA
jgi:hypothetical protein